MWGFLFSEEHTKKFVNITGDNMTKIKVRKRDARVVDFDKKFIDNAVYQAALNCDWQPSEARGLSDKIAQRVSEGLERQDEICVDEIQDLVERKLIACRVKGVDAVAKAYIEYRHDRDKNRQRKGRFAKIGIDITTGADTESQRENSNVPRGTVTTQVEMIKRLYSKEFVEQFVIPEEFNDAHNKGEIHIHDKAELLTKIPNCALIDYKYMFDNGFQLGNKWIEKPTTILTAMNVLVQVVQVQCTMMFGGLTLEWLDEHMGEYVVGSYKKHLIDAICDLEDVGEDSADRTLKGCEGIIHPENPWIAEHLARENKIAIRKTERETYKACKLLNYQLNTLSVRGESSPFVTITYGLQTNWEGRLIQRCILQERLDNFEKCGVAEFPKNMYAVWDGINLKEGDPNYDLFKMAIKTSATTAYPDFFFPENQIKHTGGYASYMG